jgi:hypothetical protein
LPPTIRGDACVLGGIVGFVVIGGWTTGWCTG